MRLQLFLVYNHEEEKTMIIKILGTGCSKCKKLEENVKEAVSELGIEATVEKVLDIKDIMAYGVMSTPALVVDEQVKVMGRVPSVEDIKKYL
jgi:small redox-active disulfide protein 2